MRGRVAQDVERVRVVLVARRQDLDRLAVRERRPQILDTPVRAHEDGFLGQLRPDRRSRVEPRGAVGKFEFRGVGQNDLHGRPEYAPRGRPQRGDPGVAGSRSRRGRPSRRRGRPWGRLRTADCRQQGQLAGRRSASAVRPREGAERAEARPALRVRRGAYGQIGPWAANAARRLSRAKKSAMRTYTGNHPFQS